MKTENLSTLKIHKLTKAQYDRANAAGVLEDDAVYIKDIPEASDTESGTTKLYNELGSNTDGAISQQAATDNFISAKNSTNMGIIEIPDGEEGQVLTITGENELNFVTPSPSNIIVDATSSDGITYIAESDIFVYETGQEITIIPNMTSTTVSPSLILNGQTYRIYTTSATTSSYFNGTTESFIGANAPMKLIFMGNKWKCLNSVRVNVEALVSNGDAGTNKIAFSNGKEENLVFRSHADAALVGEAIYNANSNRYDVLLPGVGSEKNESNGVYKGMEITIIPNSTNTAKGSKLAVNNYSGSASGSQIYLGTGEGIGGFYTIPKNFLVADFPTKMKYTGSGWRITDMPGLDGSLKFKIGNYTGNGNYGSDSKNMIGPFNNFKPQMLFIYTDITGFGLYAETDAPSMLVGRPSHYFTTYHNMNAEDYVNLIWNPYSIQFYNNTSAKRQFNTSGTTYYYIVLGTQVSG